MLMDSNWFQKLSEELSQEPGKLVPFKTDLRNEENILSAFSFIESEFGGASILVNNSGVTDTEKFLGDQFYYWIWQTYFKCSFGSLVDWLVLVTHHNRMI